MSHLDADPQRPVAGVSEPRADLLGDRDAGHLVVEELGVAVAVEREHADDHGNRRAARLLEKAVELGQVVHRLRLKPLRPRVHLAVEAADLRLDILGPGVQRRADAERGRQADAVTGRVQSLVHPLQDLDEADRVDVEDRRGADVVAGARRVALEGEDVADVERVGAEQVGLDAHQVPVATGEVHVDVEPGRLPHEQRRRQDGHPHTTERAVVDVDDLDAALLEDLRALDELLDGVAPGRVELDGDDELPRLELALKRRRGTPGQEAGRLAQDRRGHRDRGTHGIAPRRALTIQRLAHRRDVLRRRTTAAPDDAGPRLHHARGVLRHIRRRREVDEPLADAAGEPRVRLDRERQAPGRRHHLLEHSVQGARAHGAVRAQGLDAQRAQRSAHLGGRASRERHALVGEGHLRDDGQVGDRADRFDRERDLGEVRERLDDARVDAAFEESLRLLAERGARVLRRHAPERRQVLAERPDGPEDQDVAARRLAHVTGEPHAAAVDLPHLALEPVRRELEAVGAEGVGLDQVGPRRDVLGVDRLHEPRVVQVEDVEARVERHPARVEHRAHRAVAEERPGVQTLAKRARHGFP